MRKMFFLFVCVAMLATNVVFGQSVRNLTMYLEANSGSVLNSAGIANENTDLDDDKYAQNGEGGTKPLPANLFGGNETKIGLAYEQNFKSVEWLTFGFDVYATFLMQHVYYNSVSDNVFTNNVVASGGSRPDSVTTYKGGYLGLDPNYGIKLPDFPNGVISLRFDGAGFGADGLEFGLSADAKTLVTFDINYGVDFEEDGLLWFGTGVEFYANPVTYSNRNAHDSYADSGGNKEWKVQKFFDLAYVSVGYVLPFAETWQFDTTLSARLEGPENNTLNYYYMKAWEENVMNYFTLRWDANLTANFNGLVMWAGVRLDVNDLISGGEYTAMKWDDEKGVVEDKTYELNKVDTSVDIQLRAGVGYTFDFSSL